MSEIPCDCCSTEGDHPSRIICDACFQSAKGKAKCCIDTQAENKRLRTALREIVAKYENSTNAGFTLPKIKSIAMQALQEKP